MIIAKYLSVLLVGYLLGSIPFGLIISKVMSDKDIRGVGSGKTGTTNVLRTAGVKAAVMVAICDLGKGALAVALAGLISGAYLKTGGSGWFTRESAQAAAALAAVFGHTWPVFTRFKGGRGVATFLGGLLALCPPAGLFGAELLILGAATTRYVSLGSMAAGVGSFIILIPLTVIDNFPVAYLIYALAGAIFIIVMHRDNIGRLLSGKERKLGEKI